MSLIPERKKSAEELAALREKELLACAPQPTPSEEPPTTSQLPQKSTVEPKAPKEPRRKHPLRHGTPHLFEGLRPQEAVAPPVTPASVENLPHALPAKKHSDGEILQMRRRDAFQARPPVEKIRNLALHPFLLGALYLLLISVTILTYKKWDLPTPQRWLAPGIGCGLQLVFATLIYFTKPRSRHHAAMLFGISVVTLGFCLLLTMKDPHVP